MQELKLEPTGNNQAKLFNALKTLKQNNLVLEYIYSSHIDYTLSCDEAVRYYIWGFVKGLANFIGFVGGILAIIDFIINKGF